MRYGLLTVLAVLATCASVAMAQEGTPEERGEALLAKHCGRCHAVGRTGASAQPDAFPFRLLGRRYPVESLEEALAEGTISGHPDMPEFAFEPDDVGAIIDYLQSIQEP